MSAGRQLPLLKRGDTIDRYSVRELVGTGGVASVYRVRHTHLQSDHALKVLSLRGSALRRRLIDEGRSQAGLKHPNVLTVTDAFEEEGRLCLVMEYVYGPSLWAFMQDYRPTLDEALEIFKGMLRGVDAAHRHGLVHRDLKPGNVLLQPTDMGVVPKVADFGLVKIIERQSGARITRGGDYLGTPQYMAPEQIRSAKDVDHRADLFSLGCILYELVTGSRAFEGGSTHKTFELIAKGIYEPPRELVPSLPDHVCETIRRCLLPREERISDCAKVMALLYGDADTVRGEEQDHDDLEQRAVIALKEESAERLKGMTHRPARRRQSAPPQPYADVVADPTPVGGGVSAAQIAIVVAVAFGSGLVGIVAGALLLKAFGVF